MNNREEWTKLLLIGMMLIGIVAVALVSAGNLKKMGVYKEPTTLSNYGGKLLDYYHEKFDEAEVVADSGTVKKKIDLSKKEIPNDKPAKTAPNTFTDANGNVYHLNHRVKLKDKSKVVSQKKIAAKKTIKNDKGSKND